MGRFSSASTMTTAGRAASDEALRLAAMFALAFAITALPIFLNVIAQPLALVVCVAVAFGVALSLEEQAPVIILTSNIFQNIFVAMVSPYFNDIGDLDPLKSYSFVTTVVIWFTVVVKFLGDRQNFSPFVRRMFYASSALLMIYGVYFAAGLLVNPRNATVYLRNIGLPVLLFQLFLIVAAKHDIPLPKLITVILGLLVVCGFTELFAVHFWLNVTNGWKYMELLYADRLSSVNEVKSFSQFGNVITDLLDYTSTDFFNTSVFADLNIHVQRLSGPNFHPISFGYAMATLLVFAAIHRRIGLALLSLPLLVMTNTKGPVALVIFCLAFFLLARRRNDSLALKGLLITLAAYAIFAFETGLRDGDYHVLGLMGGVHGFLQNPLGHTLGQGGNLSVTDFSALDWSKFQHEGATDTAYESAFGVMLYQLGIAAFAAFAFYAWLIRTAWRLYAATHLPTLAFVVGALSTILVNGLFQEEAYFAQLSFGLVLGLTGLAFGAADRRLAPILARRAAAPAPAPLPLAMGQQGVHDAAI